MTSVCLTFDFDAVSLWIGTMRQTSATPLSRGEFGALVGVPRVLQLLARKEMRATFFVPSHTARAFPSETIRVRDEGHEIALHGCCHETPVGLSCSTDPSHSCVRFWAMTSFLRVIGPPHGTSRRTRSPSWKKEGSCMIPA